MTEHERKRVVVTGATGLIGRRLCERLVARGDEVVVLSRGGEKARSAVPGAAAYVRWHPTAAEEWVAALEGAHAVVHLAGASIFGKRWTPAYKETLRESRVMSTRTLIAAMEQMGQKPAVFACGSAVGYYGFRDDTKLDEQATPGDDFLARLCVEWEQEGARAEALGIRTVLLRTGIVLDAKEGALPKMMLPFRFFTGGPILPGSQWFSWIHMADEVGLILFAIDDARVSGALNLAAPEAQTNRDFCATLGKVMGSPSWLPVPGFALSLALGEFGSMLTEGQRAVPRKAQDLGYSFAHASAEGALRDLLKR